MIAAPVTYAEWIELINKFKRREDEKDVLAALRQGSLTLQSGVAERLVARMSDCITTRLNNIVDRYKVHLSRFSGDETETIRLLLDLHRELKTLKAFADLPVLPDTTRESLVNLVQSTADSMQSSLENSTKTDRSGRWLSIMRRNKINTL